MAFASWAAGELPMEPAGFPQADWPGRVGGIPTLARGITLAMPCVGLDAWSAAMAEMRWPGPYMVKYAFDIDREMAIPLLRLHGPPPPGAVFKIGATGDILEEDISQWDRVDGTIAGPPCPPYSRIGARRGKKILEQQCMRAPQTFWLIRAGSTVSSSSSSRCQA